VPESVRIIDSLDTIPADAWDRLHDGNPTLSHAFLDSLHRSGCASPRTGWSPQYLTLWEGNALQGAVPLYAKEHSYGEYVFDWAWADAYERHGLAYYPKLLAAVPFSPVTGARLMAPSGAVRTKLATALLARAKEMHVSSLHVLFPTGAEAGDFRSAGLTERAGVQFHWRNAGYGSFEDFLSALSHDKRKKIRQERRRVVEAGVRLRRVTAREATVAEWDFFVACYRRTYREHRSTPYLSREFFAMIAERMPDNVLLVIAERDDRPIAAALDLYSPAALYGRYWGAIEFVPGLHFEACYYQAIEFCIERKIGRFEGGAQGLHKLARGLRPVATHSLHAVGDPAFATAIADFCARERVDVGQSLEELESSSPYRSVD
jgi:predicted N-acyltransferase